MITISDLNFNYLGSSRKVYSNLSLTIKENCICGLLGKNGVGKSTLLYLISGLLTPTKGSITVNGSTPHCRKQEFLQDIFVVMEEFHLPAISLDDYININSPYYPNFSREVLEQCLADFELPAELDNLKQLSMGQRKKVYMSFALATNTRILLMDEPTNGLDIPSKAQFRRVMSRNMSEERTIIISTHQVHDVDQLLDHVIILSNDDVLMNKSTEEITNEYVFEYRNPADMDDIIYAEPTLQGNAVMAPRAGRAETPINIELLFNALHCKKI